VLPFTGQVTGQVRRAVHHPRAVPAFYSQLAAPACSDAWHPVHPWVILGPSEGRAIFAMQEILMSADL